MGSVYKRAGKKRDTWYIRYIENGKRRLQAVKHATSERQALAALAKKEEEIRKRLAEGYHGSGRITDESLAALMDKFLEYGQDKKRSWTRDRDSIKHLKEFFGQTKAKMIEPEDIERYIAWRKKATTRSGRPPTPSTINKELTCLKTVFKRAIRDRKLTICPVSLVDKLPEDNIRQRAMVREEYDLYMEKAPAWLGAMAQVACHTGMRQGELLTLTWDRVDLKRGWVQLPGELTKSGESRPVALNDAAVGALRFFLYGATGKIGPVFCLPDGRRVLKDTLHYNHMKACADADIENFRWHDWRATFITMARRAGRRDRDLMKQVGHKTDSMLRRYDRVSGEDLRELVSGLKMETTTEAKARKKKSGIKSGIKNRSGKKKAGN